MVKEMKKKVVAGDTTEKVVSSTAGRKRKTFKTKAAPGATVMIAGDFNDWNPKAKKLSEKNGVFSCTLMLAPGTYQYKLIIDGEWIIDIDNPNFSPNDCGSFNSIIVVE